MTPSEAEVIIGTVSIAFTQGRIDLAWCVASRILIAQIPEAWRDCRDDGHMCPIARSLVGGEAIGRLGTPWWQCRSDCRTVPCLACADAIRRKVPELTIDMLVRRDPQP